MPDGGTLTQRRPRGPSNFRQRDLTAAVKALEAAGKTVHGVEIAEGRVRILTSPDPAGDDRSAEEWIAGLGEDDRARSRG